MLCLCSKTYCCYDKQVNKYKFSSKGLNKRTLEDCGDGPMSKYRKVLEEAVNVTSTNRGFRTIQHSVATYEQTKKGLSYFYPGRVDSLEPIIEHRNLHTSRQLSGLLGDVILHSDWLPTPLRKNRQQCFKIDHSSTMY